MNDFEIAAIAGLETGHGVEVDVEQCLSAARKVLSKGSMQLVVAHFPGGAVAVGPGGEGSLETVIGHPGGGDSGHQRRR